MNDNIILYFFFRGILLGLLGLVLYFYLLETTIVQALKKFKKIAWQPLLRTLIRNRSNSIQFRQGVHHVLRNQNAAGFGDLLTALMKALESGSVHKSSAAVANDILKRMKG